jgi:hypothetical protein
VQADRRRREHARARAVALDREMLEKIAARGPGGASVPQMFDGMTPVWAVESVRRLDDGGFVTRDRAGRYTLTSAGLDRLARPPGDGIEPGFGTRDRRTDEGLTE